MECLYNLPKGGRQWPPLPLPQPKMCSHPHYVQCTQGGRLYDPSLTKMWLHAWCSLSTDFENVITLTDSVPTAQICIPIAFDIHCKTWHLVLFRDVLFQLAREREERNYYQLERDRVQTFWEVASKQVWLHDSDARLVVKYFMWICRLWLTARRMSRRSPSQGPRAGRVGGKAPDWSEGLQAEGQASALRTGKSSGRLEGWKHGEYCMTLKNGE